MAQEGFKRKLTAILSADVAGYSRLMGDDEAATVKTLSAYREILTTVIKQHQGRVVDSPGDNMLAEFASVVDAVESAVEIQNELKSKNAELHENRRMKFRIGINIGDVIEEGERIYGDGVNIAARLESMAASGGICISGPAFDQVESKLDLDFEYLGEQVVKNIEKPVRVYLLRVEGGVIDVERNQDLPLPDKPSIAVLPFDNISGDPEQEYFSDGITEEIITALSKIPKMLVIARNSTFTYKGRPVKVQRVGAELGVRYVLEGSVRKAGNRVRITAQLVDTITGHHLWAERYDRKLKDIFDLQDEITMKIINALQVELTEGEHARLWGRGTDNLQAYLKSLQAREHFLTQTEEGNTLARRMAEEAIALDPEFPPAYHFLALTYLVDGVFRTAKFPEQSLTRAVELTQKAITLDESYAQAHGLLGLLYTRLREHEKGIIKAEKGVALDPNGAHNYLYLNYTLRFAGKFEEAVQAIEKAIRLNPFPPVTYYRFACLTYIGVGRYEEAIAAAKNAVSVAPNDFFAHIGLSAAYSLAGREEDARSAAAEALRINPKYSIEHAEKRLPFKNKADAKHFFNALRKAGLK